MNISNKTLSLLIALSIVFTLFGTMASLSILGKFPILGAATSGIANLTVSSIREINFTVDAVYWGPGVVYTNSTRAYINTYGYVWGGNWTAVSRSFLMCNTGNVDINLSVNNSNSTAANWIGGTAPEYFAIVNESTANQSCAYTVFGNGANWTVNGSNGRNGTTFPNAGGLIICQNMSYLAGNDCIDLNLNLTIPEDSKKGLLVDTWTATASAVT